MATIKSPEHQRLGAAIRSVRVEQELTLEQACARVRDEPLNSRYWSAVERGEVNASVGSLLKMTEALSVDLASIVIAAKL